jgi:hypothetical protein
MLTPDQTTFRRAQTDDTSGITVFFSMDLTDPFGQVKVGDMEAVRVEFTADELPVIAGIVSRARAMYVDGKNGV